MLPLRTCPFVGRVVLGDNIGSVFNESISALTASVFLVTISPFLTILSISESTIWLLSIVDFWINILNFWLLAREDDWYTYLCLLFVSYMLLLLNTARNFGLEYCFMYTPIWFFFTSIGASIPLLSSLKEPLKLLASSNLSSDIGCSGSISGWFESSTQDIESIQSEDFLAKTVKNKCTCIVFHSGRTMRIDVQQHINLLIYFINSMIPLAPIDSAAKLPHISMLALPSSSFWDFSIK